MYTIYVLYCVLTAHPPHHAHPHTRTSPTHAGGDKTANYDGRWRRPQIKSRGRNSHKSARC